MEPSRGKIILVCAFVAAASAAALDIAVGAYGGVGYASYVETKIDNPTYNWDLPFKPNTFDYHAAALLDCTFAFTPRWAAEAAVGYHSIKGALKIPVGDIATLESPCSILIPATGALKYTTTINNFTLGAAAGGGAFIERLGVVGESTSGWSSADYWAGAFWMYKPGVLVGGDVGYTWNKLTFGFKPRLYYVFNTGEYMARNCDHYWVSLTYTHDNDWDQPYEKEFNDLIPVALFGVAYNF